VYITGRFTFIIFVFPSFSVVWEPIFSFFSFLLFDGNSRFGKFWPWKWKTKNRKTDSEIQVSVSRAV